MRYMIVWLLGLIIVAPVLLAADTDEQERLANSAEVTGCRRSC